VVHKHAAPVANSSSSSSSSSRSSNGSGSGNIDEAAVAATETRTHTIACDSASSAANLVAWVNAALADAALAALDAIPFLERNLASSDDDTDAETAAVAAAAQAAAAEAEWVNGALAAIDATGTSAGTPFPSSPQSQQQQQQQQQQRNGSWRSGYRSGAGAELDADLREAEEQAAAWANRPLSPLPATTAAAPHQSPNDLNAWAHASFAQASGATNSKTNEEGGKATAGGGDATVALASDDPSSTAYVSGQTGPTGMGAFGNDGDSSAYDATEAMQQLDHISIDFDGAKRKAAKSAAERAAQEGLLAKNTENDDKRLRSPTQASERGGFASSVGLDSSEDGLGWFSLNRDLI